SWTEVWLDDRGWTRVDPTGVVAPERLRRSILDVLPNVVSAPARFVRSQRWLADLFQRWDAFNMWWNDRVVKFSYADQLRLLERFGFKSPGAQELAWAFGAGLVGWLLWIAWHIGRGTAPARPDRLARAYGTLCRKLRRAGIARELHQGPIALAVEIRNRRPELSAAIHPLLLRYAQLRFGRQPAAHLQAVRDFQRAVRRLRLRARASGTRRR